MIREYRQLPIEKRRKLKADLMRLKEVIKKQQEHLYNLFLKPNDDLIKSIERVLKNEISLEQFNHLKNKIQEYKQDLDKIIK